MRRALHLVALACTCACGTTLDLGANDAAVPYDADCKAGTYSGNYACNSSPGSGALALSASGALSLRLVTVGQPTTLAIAADAAVSSTISGGTATSAIGGSLDCSSRKLTGTIAGFNYVSPSVTTSVAGAGPFTADYDADASPPALVNGVMDAPIGGGQSSTCTWAATLQ
jgi:hypothetical protein